MKAFRKTLLAIFFIVTLLGMNSVYATTVTVNSSSEFEAAVGSARDSKITVVKLGQDIEHNVNTTIYCGKEFIIDLNGHTLNFGAKRPMFDFGSNGSEIFFTSNLIIRDSSAEQTGKIISYGAIRFENAHNNDGEKNYSVTIDGGTYHNDSNESSLMFEFVFHPSDEDYNKDINYNFTVANGTFTNNRSGVKLLDVEDNDTNKVFYNIELQELTLKGNLVQLGDGYKISDIIPSGTNVYGSKAENLGGVLVEDRNTLIENIPTIDNANNVIKLDNPSIVTVRTEDELRLALDGLDETKSKTDTNTTKVRLGADITLTKWLGIYVINNMIFDLNGYKLTAPSYDARIELAYGNNSLEDFTDCSLTITDSSNGQGSLDTYTSIFVVNTNTNSFEKEYKLIIDGGIYNQGMNQNGGLFRFDPDKWENKNISFLFKVLSGIFNFEDQTDYLFYVDTTPVEGVTFKVYLDTLTLNGNGTGICNNNNLTIEETVDKNTDVYGMTGSGQVGLTETLIEDRSIKLNAIPTVNFQGNKIRLVKKEGFTVSAPVFDNVSSGYTTVGPKNISILNRGSNSLQIKTVTLSGDSSKFEISGTGTPIINPGSTDKTFSIKPVDGLDIGIHTAEIVVTDINDNEYKSNVTFEVEGVVSISVSPATIDFGTVGVNFAEAVEINVTVTNTGTETITLDNVNPSAAGPFGNINYDTAEEIAPGGNRVITLATAKGSAYAKVAGTYNGTYVFTATSVNNPNRTNTANVAATVVLEEIPTTYRITCNAANITNNEEAGTVTIETDLGSGEGLSASASATENTSVRINAVPNQGYEFVEWRKVFRNDPNARFSKTAEHTFEATADFDKVWLYAIFEKISTTYTITVNSGDSNVEKASSGDTVTITADNPEQGKEFDKWVVVSGDIQLANAESGETTFIMRTANVEVTATYKEIVPLGNIVIPTFETKEMGYSELEYKNILVEITNTAKIDPAKTSVVLGGLRPDDFEYILNQKHGFMSGPGTWDTLLSVRPKTGLGTGLSIATITLKYDCDGDRKYETIIGSGEVSFGVNAKKYTITVNGGTASVEKAKNGAPVTITADNPEQGKEFDKWVVVSGDIQLANAESGETTFIMGTANVEVTATYKDIVVTPITYTVKFNSNGGSAVPDIKNVTSGEKISKPTDPEKTDRTFGSWYKDANLTEKFSFENDTITGDITLYASWKVDISTHTYDATNDVEKTDTAGTFSMAGVDGEKFSTVFECTEGKEYTLTATPKTGYKFVAWRSTTKDGQAISTNAEYTFTAKPLRLYAVFEEEQPTTYTVTFESNGGSAVADIENVTSGSTIAKPTDPTKPDYTFAGWYKEVGLTNKFNFATDTITGDTTLFAKWNKKQTIGGGGSTTTKYTITVKQNDNGKISPETTKVEKGDNQKFEIKAEKGYEVEKVLVDGKSVGAVTEYTFEKVKEKHTIEATFKKVEEVAPVEPEDDWKNPFIDVSEKDWFYEAVKFANENKLFNGVSSTEFGPNVSMTRAMLVTVLYRLEGEPATNRSIPFADIDMSMYYANAVIWAKQNNIVNGVDETNFAPNLEVTREQLVTILYRYAQYKGKDVSVGENTNILSYDDFSELSEYAIPAMQWACGSGIITGRTTSTIAPKGTATRAEVATMLMRFAK